MDKATHRTRDNLKVNVHGNNNNNTAGTGSSDTISSAATVDAEAESGRKRQHSLSMCLMGPTESICDHRVLEGHDSFSHMYPFTIVANTLVEYYCLSKVSELHFAEPVAKKLCHVFPELSRSL